MALKKEIIQENGISTTYHKISLINLRTNNDETENTLVISVESFLNEEYRNKNQSIFSTGYIFNIQPDEDINVGIRALGYQKLKELEVFDSAEDC